MATPGDHTLAAELATRAGELLLDIRDRLTVDGAPSAVMRHEGDQRSHEYLMAALAEHRPTDAVLSEEGTAHVVHPDRTGADRIWIVDPVDGTREYSEPPRSDWAVHVALVEEGCPTAGAVALAEPFVDDEVLILFADTLFDRYQLALTRPSKT